MLSRERPSAMRSTRIGAMPPPPAPNKKLHRRKPTATLSNAPSRLNRHSASVWSRPLTAASVALLIAGGLLALAGGRGCQSLGVDAALAVRCSDDLSCQNGGSCANGTCVCAEGWQGDECQFCGGKVRLTDKHGYISDGAGNYSVGVKCSWLIDARDRRIGSPPFGGANQLLESADATKSAAALATTTEAMQADAKQPTIRLHLEEFATECGWDHLYVYDGDSVESPLLAVFSGLMYRQNLSVRRVPEVVAHSGSVLLHFFSDDAYNMSGFNISYTIGGCPTAESRRPCSGHGVCADGACTCDADWEGAACNWPRCENQCSASFGFGECDPLEQRCICRPGYAGSDCSQRTHEGYWTTVTPSPYFPLPGSASHGAAVWRDTLHIIGGESYGQAELLYTYDFNGNVWETQHSRGSGAQAALIPLPRFGASTVMYGDKIVMYGGVIRPTGHTHPHGHHTTTTHVTDEVWAFDVSARTWENITVRRQPSECNATHEMCGPLRSAGHTATVVPTWDDVAKVATQRMYAIFGHSPQFGFLNTVQEYSFGTREWKLVQTVGFPVKGGYGHSAAYDELTEKIYVYGGIVSENEHSQAISARVYAYEPRRRLWQLLTASPSVRFLHTATFVSPGLMMVFGGNTHNDTSHSFGAKCYSSDLLVYDVLCDSWHTHRIPAALHADLSRFGHSAVMFEGALYVYGGFDGQMLSDMLRFQPGDCAALHKSEWCLHTRPGRKCVWDIAQARCRAVGELGAIGDVVRVRNQDEYQLCPDRSRHVLTQQLLLDVERCGEFGDCASCTATAFGCTWCGAAGVCTKDKCREQPQQTNHVATSAAGTTSLGDGVSVGSTTAGGGGSPALPFALPQQTSAAAAPPPAVTTTTWERCPDAGLAAPFCAQLHGCHACQSQPQCQWDYELSRCRAVAGGGNRTAAAAAAAAAAGAGASAAAADQLEALVCPTPCAAHRTCANCTADECIWCQNEQRCVDKNAYTASFPYGQCREWTTMANKCRTTLAYATQSAAVAAAGAAASSSVRSSEADGRTQCGYYRTCSECRNDPACGWCDDGSATGLGRCLPGGDRGAQLDGEWADGGCAADRWFFTHCPLCQCNGHSSCGADGRTCEQPCQNLTLGANCERCRPGWWGNPVNGGACQRCECNGQAAHCHPETAKCYCSTKGLAGDHCEKCDATNHYHGDPAKGSCYYDLTIDYQFTFNLSKKEDRHFTQINFRNSPVKADIDADFTISCSVPAKMNVTVRTAGGAEKPMFSNINCSNFRYRFSKTEHRFGIVENVTSTTFYVYVYDFQPPLWIQIAFSQYPKLNLQQFFITFSTCFLLLLLVAALLWKVKQRYDMYRRRQRLYVEMEQMASRPFSKVLVEIENRDSEERLVAAATAASAAAGGAAATSSVDSITTTSVAKKRKKTVPVVHDPTSPIALEPCYGHRAAVLSLLVRLPTGGLEYSPPGQAAGLAVASALVTLGTPPSVDTFPKEPKAKRKQSQHPDSCI